MKSLVTCDQVGGSLEMWLKTASPEQLQDFYTQLLKHIKNCDGNSLVPSDKLATCKNVEEALTEYGKNLNQGENLPEDASDCSRPVTICGVNNMLNAAEDNAAKQAVVHAVTDTLRDDAGKRSEFAGAIVSRQPGNLIQQRDDGLYYGIEAKKELRNLYVSNFGNDETGDGTEAKPFATIGKALSLLEDIPVRYTIHLHAGHEFDAASREISRATLVIMPYASGPEYPLYSTTFYGYRGWSAKDFPRPIVNFRRRNKPSEFLHVRDRITADFMYVNGVAIRVYEHVEGGALPNYRHFLAGVFNAYNTLELAGCTLEVMTPAPTSDKAAGGYTADVLFRAPLFKWSDSKIIGTLDKFVTSGDTDRYSPVASALHTGTFTIGAYVGPTLHGYGGAPDHPSLVPSREDLIANLPFRYFSVDHDAATKSIFGMTLNWDPFKFEE